MIRKKNLLVTLADEKYVDQAKQLFSSAYWHGGWKEDYMLLSYEIPEEKLKWFRNKGILIKKCAPLNKEDMRFSKFYLFTPEFKRWKNIVFLDSDIIVIASIRHLANVKGFHAVHDLFPTIEAQFRQDANSQWYKKLRKNYNLKEKAFNSGVMAFSAGIIANNSFEELKKLAGEYPLVSFLGEQAFINLLFYKKWAKLPFAYNFNPFLLKHPYCTKKDPKIKGIILHFPGSRKPWNEKYSDYCRIWKENLKKADLINIKKPMASKREYSQEEIKKISKDIKKRLFFHAPVNYIDKLIGLLGIFLKEKNQSVYNALKRQQLNLFGIEK